MRTGHSCKSCFVFVFVFCLLVFFCCVLVVVGGGGNKTVKTFFSNQNGYSPMDDLATIMF